MPEPTYLEQQSTLAEATFGGDAPRGNMTPERQFRREKAEAIRKKRAENQSEQSVMESFAPHPPPAEGRVNQVNGENIGTKRKGDRTVEVDDPDHPGTRIRKKYDGPDDGDRDYEGDTRGNELRARADKAAKLAREVLDRGYDGLVDSDGFTKTQKQELLVKEMLEAAKSWPLARAVLESYGGENDPTARAARKELMEARLRDPRFVKKLSEHFNELYDGEKAFLKDIVTEAQDEYDRAEQQARLKNDELIKINEQLEVINNSLREYGAAGGRADELRELRGGSAGWESQLGAKEAELGELTRKVEQLLPRATRMVGGETDTRRDNRGIPYTTTIGGTPEPDTEVVREMGLANERIKNLRIEISKIHENRAKLKGYEDEIAKLEKEKRGLEDRQTPLIEQVSNLDLAKGVAKRKLDIARATRNTEEEQFVNKVEGMFLEAGRRSVKEDVQLNEAAQKKAIEKAEGEAGERDEEQLEKCMSNDWREPVQVGTFRKRTVYRVDKNEMKTVYDRLVQERGMEWYVKHSLESHLRSIRNQFGEDSQQYREERKRLDDKFKDTAFMKGLEAKAQERFFKNYLETGHKLKREDVSVLVETDAGLVAIDRALEKNKAVADKIDELQRKSLFSGSRAEFLKKAAKDPTTYGAITGLIAALLGAPFLYAGAAAAASVVGPAYVGAVKAVV